MGQNQFVHVCSISVAPCLETGIEVDSHTKVIKGVTISENTVTISG